MFVKDELVSSRIDCKIFEDLDLFEGHILVFLQGPDEISIMKDLCSNLTE
jgi:hypothetical protein